MRVGIVAYRRTAMTVRDTLLSEPHFDGEALNSRQKPPNGRFVRGVYQTPNCTSRPGAFIVHIRKLS
jgi:hypothetical protein